MNWTIRSEQASEIEAIFQLTQAAFQTEHHSSRTEQFIVSALRRRKTLTLSLVAVEGEQIIGHVAVSPVTISNGTTGWYGLGPISVSPQRQRQGIGSQLMKTALAELKRQGAHGCVLLGNPDFYGRFGFKPHPDLMLPGVPPEYFQAVCFAGGFPTGEVRYDEAFDAQE